MDIFPFSKVASVFNWEEIKNKLACVFLIEMAKSQSCNNFHIVWVQNMEMNPVVVDTVRIFLSNTTNMYSFSFWHKNLVFLDTKHLSSAHQWDIFPFLPSL